LVGRSQFSILHLVARRWRTVRVERHGSVPLERKSGHDGRDTWIESAPCAVTDQGFFNPSQPKSPLSPQCVAMHATMLARPVSVMPLSVCRQSAVVGGSATLAQLLRMLSHALLTGLAVAALSVALPVCGGNVETSGQALINAL
jgi:hypothetical protein